MNIKLLPLLFITGFIGSVLDLGLVSLTSLVLIVVIFLFEKSGYLNNVNVKKNNDIRLSMKKNHSSKNFVSATNIERKK